MPTPKILGVHPVVPSDDQVRETIEWQYGSELTKAEQGRAEKQVRKHFASLFLIEVSGDAIGKSFKWSEVTQEQPNVEQDNWQVAYDERPVGSNWVFFFHLLDLNRPLLTPKGPIDLPAPTPTPRHLKAITYQAP
jgi:hypothetical protein